MVKNWHRILKQRQAARERHQLSNEVSVNNYLRPYIGLNATVPGRSTGTKEGCMRGGQTRRAKCIKITLPELPKPRSE
jgi:hypothetical protein